MADHARKSVDLSYSLSMLLKEDGTVMDVNPNLVAFPIRTDYPRV